MDKTRSVLSATKKDETREHIFECEELKDKISSSMEENNRKTYKRDKKSSTRQEGKDRYKKDNKSRRRTNCCLHQENLKKRILEIKTRTFQLYNWSY